MIKKVIIEPNPKNYQEQIDEAIAELKKMPIHKLDLVYYDMVWLVCCYKGCNNVHRVRDYGIAPEYYSSRFGFINSQGTFWCGKHWKFRQRLLPLYGIVAVHKKLEDGNKKIILTNEEKVKLKNNRCK